MPLGGEKIEAMSPSGPAAQWCLEQYFKELDEQLSDGFDPVRQLMRSPP